MLSYKKLKLRFRAAISWFLVVLLFVVALADAAAKPNSSSSVNDHRSTTAATPAGVDLAKYPLMPKALAGAEAIAKMAELGLRPMKLRYPWRGYNFHREVEGGRWVFETLPVDTVVLVNAAGDQVYKADCWNRLKWVDERPCPVCAQTPAPTPAPGLGIARRVWNWLWTPWWVWPYYGSVTIDVAGPNGPYTIDSYGSHRVVVAPQGDGRTTFVVYP